MCSPLEMLMALLASQEGPQEDAAEGCPAETPSTSVAIRGSLRLASMSSTESSHRTRFAGCRGAAVSMARRWTIHTGGSACRGNFPAELFEFVPQIRNKFQVSIACRCVTRSGECNPRRLARVLIWAVGVGSMLHSSAGCAVFMRPGPWR